jgi:hypothetical protein
MGLNKFLIVVALLLVVLGLGLARASRESSAQHKEDSIILTYDEQLALAAKFSEIQQSALEQADDAHYWHGRYDELRACVAKQKEKTNVFAICLGGI